ncbi:metal-dependent hydrolase (plasmid) [Agrobacterium pusense]|uniref:metal-dependent hydrolase n=1 Tax=Agrobacterium pusense TaxID=648995 RepID=UPI0013AF8B27|nr:metal-dependent hydrolase [Agrobacterium pusense]WMW59130.1 metal-dependent hydrolase [Agrobacterium pusense]
MDNLAHTLVGAALGYAGLKSRTGLGMATLMISANLPDIDVLGIPFGETLAWRRGWTHGPISLVILPIILTACVVAYDRWQIRRRTRPSTRGFVRAGWVLLSSYIGLISHLLLDYLNTWGIRLLMPFSERWFYGDTLFIVDIWLWLIFGIAVWYSAKRTKHQEPNPSYPARTALLLVIAYIAVMYAAGRIAELHVRNELRAAGHSEPLRVLASPVLLDPLRRQILLETKDSYIFGTIVWTPDARLTLEPEVVPTNMDDDAIARAARQEKTIADFLYWSRYPFATIRRDVEGIEVIIGDARYGRRPQDGPFSVRAILPLEGTPDRISRETAKQPAEGN